MNGKDKHESPNASPLESSNLQNNLFNDGTLSLLRAGDQNDTMIHPKTPETTNKAPTDSSENSKSSSFDELKHGSMDSTFTQQVNNTQNSPPIISEEFHTVSAPENPKQPNKSSLDTIDQKSQAILKGAIIQ